MRVLWRCGACLRSVLIVDANCELAIFEANFVFFFYRAEANFVVFFDRAETSASLVVIE